MKWNGLRKLTLVTIFLVAMHSTGKAQPVYEAQGHWCESNLSFLFDLGRQVLNTKERLFIIAQFGRHESRYWNHRRLHNVREYFRLNYGDRLTPEQICYAESEPTKRAGKMRFYLGSKLVMTVTFNPQHDFCVDCCDWPVPEYYGRGKTDRPKKKTLSAPKTNRISFARERASCSVSFS